MDVIEAINKRKSIRGYKTDPVSKDLLTSILASACRAPSAMNTQPWEFIVVTGDVLNRLRAAMQNICLSALHFGLGTCIEDQGVLYPGVLREMLHIPENKKIIIAIAIGYPDWDFPANALVSGRESPDKNTRWMGF